MGLLRFISHGSRARGRPGTVLVLLLALLSLAGMVIGCGGGDATAPDAVSTGRPPVPSEVRLMVTQAFGTEPMLDLVTPVSAGLNVMNLLAGNADIETEYGGGLVVAIEGVESTFKQVGTAEAKDWFYWVDGKMADVGATSYDLVGGETVWWDYHEWAEAMAIPWSLDGVPQRLAGEGIELIQGLESTALQSWIASFDMHVSSTGDLDTPPAGPAVAVVDPIQAAGAPWIASTLAYGTGAGLFVDVDGGSLVGLGPDGSSGPSLKAAAIVVPCSNQPDYPVLLLIARDVEAADGLMALLTQEAMTHAVGLGLGENGVAVGLPVLEVSP